MLTYAKNPSDVSNILCKFKFNPAEQSLSMFGHVLVTFCVFIKVIKDISHRAHGKLNCVLFYSLSKVGY